MSGRAGRGLGFGGAVGLGVAVALLIAVIAIGRGVIRQLTGAVSLVITFAEIALCVILGGIALAVLGLLAYGGLLGRLKIAERRIGLEQLARQAPAGQLEPGASWAVRAEVLEGGAEALSPSAGRPAIQPQQAGNLPANVTRLPGADRGDREW